MVAQPWRGTERRHRHEPSTMTSFMPSDIRKDIAGLNTLADLTTIAGWSLEWAKAKMRRLWDAAKELEKWDPFVREKLADLHERTTASHAKAKYLSLSNCTPMVDRR